ncbi:MAG: hypothetical protein EHM58_20235 [Ignavibacteriae bacterium]|nr:MAG: hypothetical protein EHM58_20235 [Ignavibacteriota bacterium]
MENLQRQFLLRIFIVLISSFLFFTGCKSKIENNSNISGETETPDVVNVSNTTVNERYIGSNDVYKTKYFVIKGKAEFPKIIVDGGIHGDEAAGYLTCDTLVKNIKIEEGTLLVIPRLNLMACNANVRGLKHDFNRVFPGDEKSGEYEFRLAYEFMKLIDSLKPELVLNLHEAKTKYDADNYKNNPAHGYAQTLITCITPPEPILSKVLESLNSGINKAIYKFNIQYYPIQPNHSQDNIVSKLNIKSYTIETYKGFDLDTRIKLQILTLLRFFDAVNIKYTYPDFRIN